MKIRARAAALVVATVCVLGLIAGPAFATTAVTTPPQKLEVLEKTSFKIGSELRVYGWVRNPTQTALTDVLATVRLVGKTGKTLQTVVVPANCIVLDGLATTTYCTRAFKSSAISAMKTINVSVTGRPTFRRPLFLTASVLSRSESLRDDGARYDDYVLSVSNDHPFDVTGTVVYGTESQLYHNDWRNWTFMDAFRCDALRGLGIGAGWSGTATASVAFYRWIPVMSTNVFAEAVRALQPGINVETTEVLSPSGGTATIHGSVRDDAGAGVSAAPVVYRTSADGSSWSAPATVTADAAGSFSLTARPVDAIFYSLSFPGRAGVASASGPVVVQIHPRVSLSVPAGPASVPVTFTVTGTLKPQHPVGTPVMVRCSRRIGNAWEVGAEVTATVSPGAPGTSRYSANVTVPTGTWKIVASLGPDDEHAYTASSERTVVAGRTSVGLSWTRSTVSYSRSSTITVTLKDPLGRPMVGEAVWFDASTNNKWFQWQKTLTTDSNGQVKCRVKPTCDTWYMFEVLGSAAHAATNSAMKLIHSASVTKTVTFPNKTLARDGGPTVYWRHVRLSRGKHQIRMTHSGVSWTAVSGRSRLHGTSAQQPDCYGSTFTVKRAGYYTFKVTKSMLDWWIDQETLTIW